ncbi:MAG TPA: dihydrofolate reductase family protein [Acidobacteriota bacterium]
MRKVTFGVANSLDNYIARRDHSIDWLLWCDEAKEIMNDFWKRVDAIVMGRKTYEVALQHSSGSGGGPYGNMQTFVMSRSLKPDPEKYPGVEIVSGDAVEFLRDLKAKKGQEIVVMGGGELANPLLEAGLIDEIGFNIHPVLLGSGIPLFNPMNRQLDLELLDCRRLSNGCVYVMYRVKDLGARPGGR